MQRTGQCLRNRNERSRAEAECHRGEVSPFSGAGRRRRVQIAFCALL